MMFPRKGMCFRNWTSTTFIYCRGAIIDGRAGKPRAAAVQLDNQLRAAPSLESCVDVNRPQLLAVGLLGLGLELELLFHVA